MKRYYVCLKYKLLFLVLPIAFLFNGILFTFKKPDSGGFFGTINQYSYILWYVIGLVFLFQLYRIYTKKVYLELNEKNIVYKFTGTGLTSDYNDAEFYTAKQVGGGYNLVYTSMKREKKVFIPLNMFEIEYTEFFSSLSSYSSKDVYIKRYGEELKLFKRTDL